jgi:hypothetical protein
MEVAGSNDMKSVKKDILAILNRVANAPAAPVRFDNDATLEEIGLVSELIDSGYLGGAHVEDERGVPIAAVATGITIAGREYAEGLAAEMLRKSAKGRVFAALKYAAVFAFGLATTWITKKLGLG